MTEVEWERKWERGSQGWSGDETWEGDRGGVEWGGEGG